MTAGVPNLDPKALAAGKLALERDAEAMRTFTITDPDTYAAVGAVLIERLREYDIAKKLRDDHTKPIYAAWKKACELFKPHIDAHERLIAAIKKTLGDYDLRELAAKQAAATEARALVAAPGPAPVAAITEALTVANAPEASAEGVGTRFVWRVKRYNVDIMDPAYLIQDEKKCEAVARAHRGEEPPFIRGVVFELAAQVSGKR